MRLLSSEVSNAEKESFNSRTLGRVRPLPKSKLARTNQVSIHAPWEGCDNFPDTIQLGDVEFQFTHPGKGATVGTQQGKDINYVSIHAPWEGCDEGL